MLSPERTRTQDGPQIPFMPALPHGRIHRLREQYWAGTHRRAVEHREIAGCGEDTQVGHARDFAALLLASDPFIQTDELIVGSCLTLPLGPDAIDLA